jgi:hypothetical protein
MPRTGKHTGQISTVTYTASGGSAVAVTGNFAVEVMIGDQLVEFTGDAAAFATLLASVKGSRGLKISGYDVGKHIAVFGKGPGTLVAVVNDAVNGTGAGALTYSLSNAMRADLSISHRNQSADSSSVTYTAFSSNGSTDPLAVVEAS